MTKCPFQTWETRYVLLLWLSMVCMIPFDLARLDSNLRDETGQVKKPVMERIIETGKVSVRGTTFIYVAKMAGLSDSSSPPDVP